MSTVLVTGASGFIGREVLHALRRRGYEIHALSHHPAKKNAAVDGVSWHCADLFERDAIRTLCSTLRPDGLIHLAWESSHGKYWRDPNNAEWLAASLLLLKEFIRSGGRRAVIAGSSAEYQWGGQNDLDEYLSPTIPESLYGTTKNALREVIGKWAPDTGLNWTWCRLFNVFGPGEKVERLIPKVVSTLLKGQHLPFDRGTSIRDFLHVADAGDAIAALFQSSIQGPVNVASGNAYTLHDVVLLIATYLQANDCVQFGALPDLVNQPPRIVARVTRLHEELGWQPQANIKERIQQTCDWWKQAQRAYY